MLCFAFLASHRPSVTGLPAAVDPVDSPVTHKMKQNTNFLAAAGLVKMPNLFKPI